MDRQVFHLSCCGIVGPRDLHCRLFFCSFTHYFVGEHEINVIVKGNGSLAHLLYSMMKNVNHTQEIDNAEDNFSKILLRNF